MQLDCNVAGERLVHQPEHIQNLLRGDNRRKINGCTHKNTFCHLVGCIIIRLIPNCKYFLPCGFLLKNAGGYGIVIFDKRSEETHMNDRLLDYAIRIQSIAQAGLQYGKDKYDRERYAELREIAAEMISAKTDISMEKVRDLFCNETGYQTPKIDTRAAVFIDGKILLVHENNGTWCLPGGWCDVDQSIASNTEKEVREEAGFTVTAQRLIAVQDWRKHNVTSYVYGVVKCFVLCKYESGEFQKNIETTGIGLFGRDELPIDLAVEKTSREQILMCFDALDNPLSPTLFD